VIAAAVVEDRPVAAELQVNGHALRSRLAAVFPLRRYQRVLTFTEYR
jgi:hypothetical protein